MEHSPLYRASYARRPNRSRLMMLTLLGVILIVLATAGAMLGRGFTESQPVYYEYVPPTQPVYTRPLPQNGSQIQKVTPTPIGKATH